MNNPYEASPCDDGGGGGGGGGGAFVPSMSVSVGPGQDYDTWDEMYAAVDVQAGGTLTVSGSGSHTPALETYAFFSWDKVILSLGTMSFTSTLSLYGANIELSGNPTITGGLLAERVLFVGGSSLTISSSASLADCSGSGTVTINAPQTILQGKSLFNVLSVSGSLGGSGLIRATRINATSVVLARGSFDIPRFDNVSTGSIGEFIRVGSAGFLACTNINCGSNGITTVLTVSGGGLISRSSGGSITGTYTNAHNQAIGIPTEQGQIYADGAEKASLSTISGQGLSDLQKAISQVNQTIVTAYSGLAALALALPEYSVVLVNNVGTALVPYLLVAGVFWPMNSHVTQYKTKIKALVTGGGDTYSQSGTLITVNRASHGIDANDFINGGRVYLPAGSGAVTSGWYEGLIITGTGTYTCVSTVSQTTSGTLGTNTSETHLPDIVTLLVAAFLDQTLFVPRTFYKNRNSAGVKTFRTYLGGTLLAATTATTNTNAVGFFPQVQFEDMGHYYMLSVNTGNIQTVVNGLFTMSVQLASAADFAIFAPNYGYLEYPV